MAWFTRGYRIDDEYMKSIDPASPPPPRHLVDCETRGLQQGSDGSVELEGHGLVLDPPPGTLFAAAFYRGNKTLITVSGDGVATLYRPSGGTMVGDPPRAPGFVARMEQVRFTRIPGLVYLLLVDVEHERRISVWAQDYPDVSSRLILDTGAEGWDAIPIADPEQSLLDGCYRIREGGVDLNLGHGSEIRLELSEALAEPFRSGPFDPLAQAVFVFSGHGIVCQTKSGWSLHSPEGARLGWFSDAGIRTDWWRDPVFEDGVFCVVTCDGPNSTTYRMDIASGKLVPATDR